MSTNSTSVTEPTPKKLTLHEMRKKSGANGSAVARLCNTTYRSLRNWETGVAVPNIVNINDLLQMYGYTFDELDLEPFYVLLQDRTNKQKQQEEQLGNTIRERRQLELDSEPVTKSDSDSESNHS